MSSAPSRRTDSAKGTRWAWGRHIGKGSFGDVFLAWEEGKEQAFAVKVVRLKSDEKLDNCKSLLKEVEVMKGAGQHKRIVHCIDALFDSRGMLCIVMEYMGGGAFGSFLRAAKSPLRPHIAAKCIRQVVEGMAYLHKRHIYHRDLKGDNILIKAVESCGTPLLKICDFGNSKMRNDKMMDSLISTLSDANGQTTALTVSGTALWMAPEMIQAAKHSNGYSPSKADIWALGIVACEILNRGKTPWPTYEHPVQALFDIGQWNGGKGGKDLPPNAPSGVDKECRDFIASCLRVKSEDRLGADQLLRHRYLRDVDPDPESGLTSSEDSSVSSTSPRQTEERVNEHSVLFPVRSAEVLQVLCSRLTKGKNNEAAAHAKTVASPNLTQTEEWTTQSCITPPDSPPQPPLDGPRVEIATTMTTTGRTAIHSTSSTTATTATSSSSATSAASTVAASPGEKAADTSFYTEYEEEGEEEYEEEEEEEHGEHAVDSEGESIYDEEDEADNANVHMTDLVNASRARSKAADEAEAKDFLETDEEADTEDEEEADFLRSLGREGSEEEEEEDEEDEEDEEGELGLDDDRGRAAASAAYHHRQQHHPHHTHHQGGYYDRRRSTPSQHQDPRTYYPRVVQRPSLGGSLSGSQLNSSIGSGSLSRSTYGVPPPQQAPRTPTTPSVGDVQIGPIAGQSECPLKARCVAAARNPQKERLVYIVGAGGGGSYSECGSGECSPSSTTTQQQHQGGYGESPRSGGGSSHGKTSPLALGPLAPPPVMRRSSNPPSTPGVASYGHREEQQLYSPYTPVDRRTSSFGQQPTPQQQQQQQPRSGSAPKSPLTGSIRVHFGGPESPHSPHANSGTPSPTLSGGRKSGEEGAAPLSPRSASQARWSGKATTPPTKTRVRNLSRVFDPSAPPPEVPPFHPTKGGVMV